MSSATRAGVLLVFRKLHRTRMKLFHGDDIALNVVRTKINEEFRKHRLQEDEKEIKELIEAAENTDKYLRANLVQAEYNPQKDTYKLNITEDTVLRDNIPYNPDFEPPKRTRRKKCSDDEDKKS